MYRSTSISFWKSLRNDSMEIKGVKHIEFLVIMVAMCLVSPVSGQETGDFAEELKLKDYRPVSVFRLEEHHPDHAKFSCIDIHSHPYEESTEAIKAWAERLEANNIEKVIILTYAHGEEFDRLYDLYTGISDRFEMWCGFDLDHFGEPGFEKDAVAELERCWKKGARGVGELGDKGLGESYCRRADDGTRVPTAHLDDPRFDALLEKCAELGMPVNVHIGDPIWMYEDLDEHNDGYMNAAEWKIDLSVPGILDLYQTCTTLEKACSRHPETMFIACHFINLSHDYAYLSEVLDSHPNLYLDNAARHVETCVTPRATKRFYEKYQDRIFFGTDNTPDQDMYSLQWRILETEDEHFYAESSYHWPLHGIGLDDSVLKKIYHDNYQKIVDCQKRGEK